MKKTLIILTCLFLGCILSAQNYTAPKDGAEAGLNSQGIMIYNPLNGKVSIGGVAIDNDTLQRYLSPQDYRSFKSGRTTAIVGGIVACAGAIPLGWGLGTIISGGNANAGLLIGGGIAFVGGAVASLIGESNAKKVINTYNASLAFQPEVHFGATANGIGLAFVF